MLSVRNLSSVDFPRQHPFSSNMITEVNNRKKHPSGADRLDSETLLVILETVLQTHVPSKTTCSSSVSASTSSGTTATPTKSPSTVTLNSPAANKDSVTSRCDCAAAGGHHNAVLRGQTSLKCHACNSSGLVSDTHHLHTTDMEMMQTTHSCETANSRTPTLKSDAAAKIDGKIEKAMDSVKVKLCDTIGKEVKSLRSQVALLQQHNAQLETENRILRQAATAETLARLGHASPGKLAA